MLFRYFRRLDTGEFCTGTMGSDGPFGVPLDAHRQNWADAHGIPLDQIEGFEVDDASKVPDLSLARPPLPGPPPEPAKHSDPVVEELKQRVALLESRLDVAGR